MSDQPPLAEKMRALAVGHPRSAELVEKADAFEAAVNGYYSDEPTVTAPQFLGCFARARKLWCEITGEPLA